MPHHVDDPMLLIGSLLTYDQSRRRRYVDQLVGVIKSTDVENSRCALFPERVKNITHSPVSSPYDAATLKSSVGRSHQFCSFSQSEMSSLGHLISESHLKFSSWIGHSRLHFQSPT